MTKLVNFSLIRAALPRKLRKIITFYVILAVRGIEIEEKCVILPSQSERSAKDILLNRLSITTEIRAILQYWDCNPNGRSFPIFEGGLW